ncbi:MAG: hypothetical protein Q9163_000850 [Psora crenata]
MADGLYKSQAANGATESRRPRPTISEAQAPSTNQHPGPEQHTPELAKGVLDVRASFSSSTRHRENGGEMVVASTRLDSLRSGKRLHQNQSLQHVYKSAKGTPTIANTPERPQDSTQVLTSSAIEPSPTRRMVLIPTLAHEMELKKATLAQNSRAARPLYGEHLVQCECACEIEDGIMQTSTTEHICYKCLLEDENRSILSAMEKLAQRRRALWLVHDQDCPASPKALKERLRCGIQNATRLIEAMRHEGFLTAAGSGGVRGLVPVRTTQIVRDKMDKYFDPMTNLGSFETTYDWLVWLSNHPAILVTTKDGKDRSFPAFSWDQRKPKSIAIVVNAPREKISNHTKADK